MKHMNELKLIKIQNDYLEGTFYYFIKENKMFLLDSRNNFITLFSLNLKQTEEKIAKQIHYVKNINQLKSILNANKLFMAKNINDLKYICSFYMNFNEEDVFKVGKNYLIMEV